MKCLKYLLMAFAGFALVAQSSVYAVESSPAVPQAGAKEEVKEKCVTLKSTGEKKCFTIRRTLLVKPSEAKDAVEVSCTSKKTGEKKSVWMYKGPGARLLSDKEICMKQFGEGFTNIVG